MLAMRSWVRAGETLHVLALAVWLGTLVMTGVAAAVIFPEMRRLDPALATYSNYTGEHWMLAAGHVAAKIFAISDTIQLACAALAGLTFLVALFSRRLLPFRFMAAMRLIGLLTAFGALSYQAGSVGPAMQRELGEYWMAAQEGRNDDAAFHQLLFREQHPKASRTLGISALAVLVALAAGAWTLSNPPRFVPMPTVDPEYGED